MAWPWRDGATSPKTDRKRSSAKCPTKTPDTLTYAPLPHSPTMPLKSGDTERIKIMQMVKEGKMTIDGALQTAYGLGVASTPYEDVDELNKPAEKRRKYIKSGVHNFGVLKYSRANISTKCVLQIDFQEQVFCLIVRGTTQEQKDFMDLKGIDSEDGSTRLQIFLFDATELDLDAGSLEDKNKVVRLFNAILEGNSDGLDELTDVVADDAKASRVLKESMLEKRGHSAAFLVWAKRFVRVKHGELCYFRAGEEKNQDSALCVIQLKHGLTMTKKLDHNAFILITDKKEFSFRVPSSVSKLQSEIERERDDWIIAIQEGSRPSRIQSVLEPIVNITPQDVGTLAHKQESYLKTVISTLQDELEQLGSMLTVIEAPMKASVQVKRVREVVRSLDQEVRTGLLSWTVKAQALSTSKASNVAKVSSEGVTYIQSPEKNLVMKSNGEQQLNHPYTYTDTYPVGGSTTFRPVDKEHSFSFGSNNEGEKFPPAAAEEDRLLPKQHEDLYEPAVRDRKREDKEYTTVEYQDERPKVNMLGSSATLVHDNEVVIDSVYNQSSDDNWMLTFSSQESKDTVITESSSLENTVNKSRSGQTEREGNEAGVQYAQVNKHKAKMRSFSIENQTSIDKSDTIGNADENTLPTSSWAASVEPEQQVGSLKGDELTNDNEVLKLTEGENIDTSSVSCPPQPPLMSPIGAPPMPPPFAVGISSLPEKKVKEPSVKLKQWFWTKVPEAMVPGSVWMEANDRLDAFDISELESFFVAENAKKIAEVTKPKKHNLSPKTLLDPKKAQNLGIFLSGFKIKAEDVERKLNFLTEEEGLSLEQIISIKRFQPTTEEADLFKNFQGDKGNLSSIDQFVMKLCDIPNLSCRLDLLITILEFPMLYEEIGPAVEGLVEAYRNLKNNESFVRLLEYVLAIGNFMNAGTSRGGAYGFRLTSLTKLVDIRSSDKKHTLLKFIVEQLFEHDLDALQCYKEVPALLKPIDISIKGLEGEIDVMKKDLIKVKNIVNRMKGKEITNRKSDEDFVQGTEEFRAKYQSKLEMLEKNCCEIKDLALYLKTKFGEPSSNYQEWMNAVSDFFKHMERAVRDEEKRRKRLSPKMPSKEQNPISNTDPEAKKGKEKAGKKVDEKVTKGLLNKEASRPTPVLQTGDIIKSNPLFMRKMSEQGDSPNLGASSPPNRSHEHCKSGYLEKQTGTKLGGSKNKVVKWEKRYFEVTENGYLYSFKKKDGKCTGSLYLPGSPIKRSEEDELCIIVESEQETLHVRASSRGEADEWFDILFAYSTR